MADLTGKKIANTYKDLLQINSSASNSGIDETLRRVQDGAGTNSSLKLSQTSAAFTGNVSIAGSLKVTGTFQPSNLQTTNIIATSITTSTLNATNLIFQDVSVSSLRTGDLFATTVSAGTVSATTVAATNITLAGEPVATSAGLATVSSTMATSIANVSAALETRIAGVSSTFAATSAALETRIATVSSTFAATSATLETRIATVSNTLATSIANVSAALQTKITTNINAITSINNVVSAINSVVNDVNASAIAANAQAIALANTSIAANASSVAINMSAITSVNTIAVAALPKTGGTVTGDVSFHGSSITLGNSMNDIIYGSALFGRDIIPSSATDRYLGDTSRPWNFAYLGDVVADNITVSGTVTATEFYGGGSNLTGVASAATSATLETRIAGVSSTFATTSATLETRIAGVSSTFAATSATLETRIAGVSVLTKTNLDAIASVNTIAVAAASAGTSATLETRIAGVSSTFAATSATLETRIATVSSTFATTSATLETRIATVSSTFATTSATLETRIATVSSTMATSIGNQMPKSGGTFTGNVAFDAAISVVGQVHTTNGVKVSSSYPYVNFSETDTTDLNSSLISNGGKFQLGTANNSFGSFTSRFEIDHSTGNANFTANVTATAFYGDGSNLTGIAAASVGTSATLETRIAGVSSTFAATSATLATSIATAAAAAVAFAIALG